MCAQANQRNLGAFAIAALGEGVYQASPAAQLRYFWAQARYAEQNNKDGQATLFFGACESLCREGGGVDAQSGQAPSLCGLGKSWLLGAGSAAETRRCLQGQKAAAWFGESSSPTAPRTMSSAWRRCCQGCATHSSWPGWRRHRSCLQLATHTQPCRSWPPRA